MSEEIDMIDSTKESIEWIKPIKGHEQYWITNNGMVWSRKRNRWMKPFNSGHLQIKLNDEQLFVHRLVYQHFVGPIIDGYVIHHLDFNKFNNIYTNLKMMTDAEHARMHNKGKKHSQQSKQKMSKAKKGKPSWIKGLKWSEESKQKMSESHKKIKKNRDSKTGRFIKE